MNTITNHRHLLTVLAAAVIAGPALSGSAARGNNVVFTVDSSKSSLQLSIDTPSGVPVTSPQFPGSDTVSLSGTQNVDISSSTIAFLSTGNVQFGVQPSAVSPGPGGVFPGSQTGNYGLLASIPGIVGGPGPGNTGLIAGHGFVGNISSIILPLVGTSFNATGLTISLFAGVADVNVTLLGSPVQATINLPGGGLNGESGGTLTQSGGLYTLTVPILFQGDLTVSGVPLVETYTGQLVATARVPEPATWVLAAVGGLAVIACRRVHRPQ
ncbi:MAG TPA: PEP-CTERM sorting domain-containing protein [Pirellulales bacterium]|nr:PEP-CTERM sorting domain-containing protein [Pirellulales bacterium]